ncbi:hypothetical protein RB614_33890 [Phytohabitans sp. ZYX-F-186]|uniref:Uncharacterized protein n=1 Tax=Phytohabitans maris TaxID=3071409 RepID=A0ABU0ZR77_9ACTN|nr:hypothetical protein [Phytohabitans sp. ZYX-F-186]MDQ7909523.1 hypothetical protein [Phytohabitans sp. ZYX-F-186]
METSKARWLIRTPLGRPVDPDVKSTYAVLSKPTSDSTEGPAAGGSTPQTRAGQAGKYTAPRCNSA